MRRVDVVELEGERCVGTVHEPATRSSRIGLLMLNPGYAPRDGQGGLAVKLCDALASRGVPCFRYDLPGLGDAPGPLPERMMQYFALVTRGDFTQLCARLVREVCAREQLDGVVLGGLCGGAVNALFASAVEPKRIHGLLLLEPELYLSDDEKREPRAHPWLPPRAAKQIDRVVTKLLSSWWWMKLLSLEHPLGRKLPLPREAILSYLVRHTSLPDVTNVPLTLAWQRWVREGRPVLVITAQGKLRERFFERITDAALQGVTRKNYAHVRVPNTNHIFTTGGASDTVTDLVVRHWPMLS